MTIRRTRRPPHLEGGRDDGKGIYISKYPDVCRSPSVPIPYTIIAYESDDINTATTVRYTKKRAHNMASLVSQCFGDEPGTGLGIKSGTVGSVCHHKEHSRTVRVEGEWAVRHSDEVWMNNKNTTGKIVRPGSSLSFSHTPPIAEYGLQAAASSAAAAPAPVPETVPRPSAEIIDFQQWKQNNRPSPSPNQSPGFWRWWRLTPVGVFLGTLLTPTQLADGTLPIWEHYAPTDGFETELQSQARELYRGGEDRYEIERWYAEQLQRHKEDEEAETHAPPSTAPEPGVSVQEEDERQREECGIRPHSTNKGLCSAQGRQSHHGFADFAFRTGTRDVPGHTTPGAPSLNDALTVCLTPGTHSAVHRQINSPINNAGRASGTDTVPFSFVRERSYAGLDGVPQTELSEECRELYKRLLDAQFAGVGSATPLRGRLTPTENMMNNLSGPWGFQWP